MHPMDGLNQGGYQQPQSMVQQILTNRFQPTAQDVGNSALAGISNNSYVNPQNYADQRMKQAVEQMASIAQMQKMQHDMSKVEAPKLQEVYDPNSPTGTRFVTDQQALGQYGKPSRGTKLSVGSNGEISFEEGSGLNIGGGGNSLTKPTRGKIEEKLLNSTDAMSRLNSIQSSFKPEYLQLGTRAGNKIVEMKDFLGRPLDANDRTQLSDFTTFRQNTTTNLNQTIKDATGTAMGAEEAVRIMSTVPNSGSGMFDGDSPTQFKTKLDNSTKLTRNAIMRYNFALANGLNPLKTGIDLEKVPDLIDKKGAEIEAQIKHQYPNAPQEQVDMETKARLGKMFGMR